MNNPLLDGFEAGLTKSAASRKWILERMLAGSTSRLKKLKPGQSRNSLEGAAEHAQQELAHMKNYKMNTSYKAFFPAARFEDKVMAEMARVKKR